MRKSMITGIIVMILIIVFTTVYWIYEPERQAAAQRDLLARVTERGARNYIEAECAKCHGVAGRGLDGPSLDDTELPMDSITKIIERGVPDTEMAAWSVEDGGNLKEHEILDITTFITNWDRDLLYALWEELGPEMEGIPLSTEMEEALGEALTAIRNEELFWAKLKLDEALAAADLMFQRAWIERVIEEVANNNLFEAGELLETVVTEGGGHTH